MGVYDEGYRLASGVGKSMSDIVGMKGGLDLRSTKLNLGRAYERGGLKGLYERGSAWLGLGIQAPTGYDQLRQMAVAGDKPGRRFFETVSGGQSLMRQMRRTPFAPGLAERGQRFAEELPGVMRRRRTVAGVGAGAAFIGAGMTMGYGNLFTMALGGGAAGVVGAGVARAWNKDLAGQALTRASRRGGLRGAKVGAALTGIGLMTGII
jgi:hypothetical protein